jgi:chromate transporter
VSAPAHAITAGTPRPTTAELFLSFAWIGAMGFGGVMPWVKWMVVDKRRWLSQDELIDILSLAQILPGGNVMNMSVMIGRRFRGLVGALAAFTGLVLPPSLVVIVFGAVYAAYGDLPQVQAVFRGLSAVAAGLILAMAGRFLWPLRRDPRGIAVAGVTVALVLAGVRLPVLLGIMLPASLVLAWAFRR